MLIIGGGFSAKSAKTAKPCYVGWNHRQLPTNHFLNSDATLTLRLNRSSTPRTLASASENIGVKTDGSKAPKPLSEYMPFSFDAGLRNS